MNSSTQRFTGDDVYLGVWTNWSHGRIRGATLTMNRRNGGLLTAFLALLVGTAGTSFWRIGCYFIHRYFSSKNPTDALYHQRQAILRNSANSQSGFVTLFQICWAWRRITTTSFWRFLPSLFFALVIFIGFAISGIFSSAVATSMGQEVLLTSPNCGTWGHSHYDPNDYSLVGYVSEGLASSLLYAQRCYHTSANPRNCAVFFQPRLQWKADRNATCPFPDKKICLNDSGNLRLDSGYINSDHHLGINSPPEMIFFVRNVVECALLQTRGYTENSTLAVDFTEYFYGKSLGSGYNSTYQYPIKETDRQTVLADYVLRSVD